LGLNLEVMGAQVHPLVPHHLGKMLHCSVDDGGLAPQCREAADANQLSYDKVQKSLLSTRPAKHLQARWRRQLRLGIRTLA
jgi:hypothetical protein